MLFQLFSPLPCLLLVDISSFALVMQIVPLSHQIVPLSHPELSQSWQLSFPEQTTRGDFFFPQGLPLFKKELLFRFTMFTASAVLYGNEMHFVSASLGINACWGLLHSWVQLAGQVISLAFLLKAFRLRFQPEDSCLRHGGFNSYSACPLPTKLGPGYSKRTLEKLGPNSTAQILTGVKQAWFEPPAKGQQSLLRVIPCAKKNVEENLCKKIQGN